MPEQSQNPILRLLQGAGNFIQHPVDSIGSAVRNRWNSITENPGGTIARGLGGVAGGLLGGPIGAAAGGRGAEWLLNFLTGGGGGSDYGPPGGYPGITSQNQANNANPQGQMAQFLGIPNYGAGNPGSAPANSFLTGNFSPSQMQGGQSGQPDQSGPLVNLNYGQNPQEYQMQGGGTPGITGPNIYAGGGSGGGSSPGGYHSSSSGYLGATTNLAGNGRGQTVGYMTMNQLENMLNAGMGRNGIAAHATQRREVSEARDARRNAGDVRQVGQSVRDFLMQ